MKYTQLLLLKILFLSLFITSCKKDIEQSETKASKSVADYDYKIVHDWNTVFLEIERYALGYAPAPTSHALGYWSLAMYESSVLGMPLHNSIANRYPELRVPTILHNQEYHWPTVVNSVSNFLLSRMFAEVNAAVYSKINNTYIRNEKNFIAQTTPEVYLRSKNHGEAVGAAFWEWMKTDTELFEGYKDIYRDNFWEEKTELFAWQPTFPGPGDGRFPYWGKGRTMAIKDDLLLCKDFREYVGELSEDPTSAFYVQAREVLAQNTPSLSFNTKWIGEFWSDDIVALTFSPPSRWIAIADQIYAKENTTLDKALECNAKIGIALHDAGIGCWNSKYYYNLERPQTYINRNIDPTWKPNLNNPMTGDEGISPNFPAYPSGHATFGAAGAEAISSIFGYSYSFTDLCHENRPEFFGMPRSYKSFHEAALENAWSRVPLGVHYRMDSDEGMRYGAEIGRSVNRLPWRK